MATDLAVRIATILDSTGLKKADKAIGGLQKQVKSLGNSLGIALSTTAVIAYGKAAVKAFADDEAAARRLATAVDNLGLSYFKADVEDFISKTEKSAAILDDKLRPAFQALLNTTGSLTRSQTLLNNAITISRASGEDLSVVAQDLANGYIGITKGLKKYNTGLTQAELKTKSFSEILGILLSRSAGAADAYLGTTSYQMEVLTVAAANAQEVIGKGLVDAFAKIGNGSTAEDAADTIASIANAIANVETAIGTALGAVNKFRKAWDWTTTLGGLTGSNGYFANQFAMGAAAEQKRVSILSHSARSSSPAGSWKRTEQQRKAEEIAAKRAKELAALQQKQLAAQKALTAEQKKQAALKKAGSIFDLDQIQLIAALKGDLSKEEQRRVEAQLALLNGNEVVAKRLTDQIIASQDKTGALTKLLQDLGNTKINDPFAAWLITLEKIKAAAASVGGGSIITDSGNAARLAAEAAAKAAAEAAAKAAADAKANADKLAAEAAAKAAAEAAAKAAAAAAANAAAAATANGFASSSSMPSSSGSASQFGSGTPWAAAAAGATTVNVQIDGKTIASALIEQSLSGNQSYANRRTGGFE